MEMQFQQQLDGPFALEILSLIAEGDSVAAEAIGKGRRATTGRSYVQHYSYHFRIVGDRIADIRLYQDTFHHWDVWNDSRHAVEPAYMKARHTGAAPEQPAEPASDAVAEDEITANKKAVRRFLRAVRDRDPQATRASWSPAGMWSFAVGEHYSPELRAFHGAPRWNLEGMINMQLNSASNSREPMTLDIYSLIAEEDRLSAEAVGFLIRDSGRSYRQHYSFHFKARHGRLIEGHVYQDTLHMYDVTRDPPGETPVAVPITSPT
jgi:ketosteroid isomerase-like protein